ncbi:MAG: hypothetical protein AAF847_17135 [Bacteroidota bacterium]
MINILEVLFSLRAVIVKIQQGRVFHTKHSKATQQRIRLTYTRI